MSDPDFRRIGIVGLGLIGGSIALAVRKLWPATELVGVDRTNVVGEALRRQIVDAADTELAVLQGADLVVLAAPVRQTQELVLEVAAHLDRPALITDTGSTKREIVDLASQLPSHLRFLGGHPLGGAAAGGLNHAWAELFADRPWILTPDDRTEDGDLAARSALGAAPRVMSADEHDRLMAFVSHLPQLTASALMYVVGRAIPEEQLTLSGRGLIDTTRLAGSPAAIWKDIVGTNADEIGPAVDQLIGVLQDLRRDLCKGDHLVEVFSDAARARRVIS
jgi:prephenate dehydrogenase